MNGDSKKQEKTQKQTQNKPPISPAEKRSPKKQYKLRPVSSSRLEALKRYRRLRDKFLEEHPVCMFPGCNSREVTLHHSKGRIGSFLTDKRYFKSLCWSHHSWVESHPGEARKLGLSQSRLEK